MDEAILKYRRPERVRSLILDNRKTQTRSISASLSRFKNLTSLSLSNVGLGTLDGFPNLRKLHKLELSENRLSCGFGKLVETGCFELKVLKLGGNFIRKLDELEVLADLPSLVSLDLLGNPVTKLEGYREDVFRFLPKLEYLDGYDRDMIEEEETDEEESEIEEEEESEEEEEEEERNSRSSTSTLKRQASDDAASHAIKRPALSALVEAGLVSPPSLPQQESPSSTSKESRNRYVEERLRVAARGKTFVGKTYARNDASPPLSMTTSSTRTSKASSTPPLPQDDEKDDENGLQIPARLTVAGYAGGDDQDIEEIDDDDDDDDDDETTAAYYEDDEDVGDDSEDDDEEEEEEEEEVEYAIVGDEDLAYGYVPVVEDEDEISEIIVQTAVKEAQRGDGDGIAAGNGMEDEVTSEQEEDWGIATSAVHSQGQDEERLPPILMSSPSRSVLIKSPPRASKGIISQRSRSKQFLSSVPPSVTASPIRENSGGVGEKGVLDLVDPEVLYQNGRFDVDDEGDSVVGGRESENEEDLLFHQ